MSFADWAIKQGISNFIDISFVEKKIAARRWFIAEYTSLQNDRDNERNLLDLWYPKYVPTVERPALYTFIKKRRKTFLYRHYRPLIMEGMKRICIEAILDTLSGKLHPHNYCQSISKSLEMVLVVKDDHLMASYINIEAFREWQWDVNKNESLNEWIYYYPFTYDGRDDKTNKTNSITNVMMRTKDNNSIFKRRKRAIKAFFGKEIVTEPQAGGKVRRVECF